MPVYRNGLAVIGDIQVYPVKLDLDSFAFCFSNCSHAGSFTGYHIRRKNLETYFINIRDCPCCHTRPAGRVPEFLSSTDQNFSDCHCRACLGLFPEVLALEARVTRQSISMTLQGHLQTKRVIPAPEQRVKVSSPVIVWLASGCPPRFLHSRLECSCPLQCPRGCIASFVIPAR